MMRIMLRLQIILCSSQWVKSKVKFSITSFINLTTQIRQEASSSEIGSDIRLQFSTNRIKSKLPERILSSITTKWSNFSKNVVKQLKIQIPAKCLKLNIRLISWRNLNTTLQFAVYSSPSKMTKMSEKLNRLSMIRSYRYLGRRSRSRELRNHQTISGKTWHILSDDRDICFGL